MACLLGALTSVTYWPVGKAGYIWDDDANVVDNPTLHSVDGLRQIWFVPGSIQQYYPLMYTSYWLEYRLWGLNPIGYHVVNVLLHATAVILFWRLLVRLRVPGAFLASAVFAVHPVNVESVAWITERKTCSAWFWQLPPFSRTCSSICRQSCRQQLPRHEADIGDGMECRWFCSAWLFAKTVVVTLPVVLLVFMWWKQGRVSARDVRPLVPFFALSVVMGLITRHVELNQLGCRGMPGH